MKRSRTRKHAGEPPAHQATRGKQRAVRFVAEAMERRLLMTWTGAVSGSTNDSAHLYNNTANWAGGIIDDSFSGVTLTANTVLYFNAARTTTASGLNLSYGGNYNLSFASTNTSAQTLTLGGDITATFGGPLVTIGDPTNTLNLALGTVTRNIALSIGNTLLIQNTVSGTGSLNESGSGTLTLAGADTNSGGVTLSSGQLNINTATAIGTGRLNISGGTIDNTSGSAVTLTTNNLQTWGANFTFGGSNALTMGTGAVTLGTGVIVTTNGSTLSDAGIIADGGAGYSLTKAGTGTLTLSGVNTFAGGITLSAGQLNINNARAVGTGQLSINGGTIDNTSGAAITLTNNNAQVWGGDFTFAGSSGLNLGTGAVSLGANRTVTVSASTLTVGGVISGAFSLTKAGAGTLTVSGANTFTGGTNLSVGQLNINNATALGAGTFTITAGTTIDNTSGATIIESNNNPQTWNGGFTFVGSNALNLSTGAVTLGASLTLTDSTSTLTVGGAIGDGGHAYSITKAGAGTLTLTAAGTFSGGVFINAGILSFGNGALGSGHITFSAASTIQWNANTQDVSSKIQAIPAGVIATLDTNGNSVTLANAISGAGSLKKIGTGTLTLSGNNTYAGGLNLIAGQVNINSATALGTGTFTISGGTIDNTSGATVTQTNNNAVVWAASFTFTGTSSLNLGTGAVTLTAAPTVTSSTTATNLIVGGVISGAFGLTKSGNGMLTLAGANTFTGTTVLSAGTIDINNATALGTGTFNISGGKIDNTTGSALTLTGNNAITWVASVTFTGTSNLNLGTGAVTLTASPTITTTAGTLTLPGVISGAFLLTKSGNGTLLLSASNIFSGGLRITAGILDINNAGALGTGNFNIGGGTLDNTSGSLITLNNNPVTLAGTLTFAGTNNLTFGTGVETLTASRTISVTAGTLTLPGVIADGGSNYKLTASGAGTLVLSGVNTFGGGVALTVGTLDINNAKAVGTGAMTISSGTIDNTSGAPITLANNNTQSWSGTFTIKGTNNLNLGTGAVALTNTTTVTTTAGTFTVGGIISGAKSLTKSGAGTLVLGGNNTYSLGTIISAGTLLVNNAAGSGTGTGAVTVSNGATLSGTGGVSSAVTVNSGGTFTPGSGGPSTFNTGNLTLASGSTLNIVINGNIVGSGYSQVNVTGTASVTGSNLNISGGRTGHDGTVLTFINNDAADAITGAFAGLSQGASTGSLNGVSYNASYIGGTGNDATLTAATAATSTALTSGTNPTIYNQSVTFTATITSTATGTPTGTVTFMKGASTLGTAALNGAAVATLTISTLPVGSDLITAFYGGDTSFSAGTSSAYTQTVTAGPPAMVVFTQQPSTVAAGVVDSPSITVAVEDQYGNIVTTDNSAVTLWVASGPASASGTLTLSAAAGVATFSNVQFDTTGVYTLSASDGALNAATSNNFTVTSGQPQFVCTQQPGAAVAGSPDSPPIVLEIEDQFGNVITTDNSTVTLAVSTGPSGATGTLAVAASSGVATFSNVILDTVGTYTLVASDGALTPFTSNSFSIAPAGASQVIFAQQPDNVTAGGADAPAIVVDVEDPYGNVVTTDNSTVTLAVASGPGSASGTVSVPAINGVATFSNVQLDMAGSYTLSASDGSLTPATSNSLAIAPASASQLAFSQQPSNAVAGATDSPAVSVNVEDSFGNIVTTDSSTVALTVASGPGSAGGTLSVSAVNGLATFANISFNTAGTYTLTATDAALAPATSNNLTVTPASASQLAYGQQPGTATVNAVNITAITVNVEDQFGNIVTTDSSTVTLAIASGPGSASGTLSAVASAGVATFNNITLDTVGTYTLTAGDGTLIPATSPSFAVVPASASQLVYVQQPSNSTAGVANSPAVVVDVEDQFGNIVTTDSSTVALAISSGPGAAIGTLAVSAVNGVATFTSLKFNTAGAYTLTASDPSLASATSGSFLIAAAPASQLVIAQQPSATTAGVADSPSILVDVEDQFGNVITTDGSNIEIAVTSGPGAASGTLTVAASSGVASFSNFILTTAGAYTLAASDGALAAATSSSFTVSPAAADKLIYTQQPSSAAAGIANSPAIVAAVEDAFGNVVTSDSSNVTLAAVSGPGIATGTLSLAASNGITTFANVKFLAAGTYTLAATDGALTLATSGSFTISPAAAAKLAYIQMPGNVSAGVSESPAIVVDVQDAFGNIVATDSSTVTIAAASGPGGVTGTVAIAAIAGVATFNNLILDTSGTYTMSANDGSLTVATSASFTVTPAAASKLVYSQQPSSVAAGVADSPSIVVDVEDPFGNIVTNNSSNTTLSVASGPGPASGWLTVAVSSGIATFSNVKFTTAGTYTLTASDGGLSLATSNGFTVVPLAASQLVFAVQPGNATAGVADNPSIVVDVDDQFGNVFTSDDSIVTISVASGPGIASGTLTVAAVNGVATFGNVRLDTTGVHTLTAGDGDLTSATSTSFTVLAAAASQLVFAQQPGNVVAGMADSPAITVDVEDQFGNVVTTDSSTVTLAVASGVGVASGTLSAAAVNGIAEFANVKLVATGNYTLAATDNAFIAATSNSFAVSPAPSSKVAYFQQPDDVSAGVADAPSIVVDVEDQYGNIVTSYSSSLTITVASGPGVASGMLTVSAVNGVATLGNVMFNAAGSYTLTANDGTLTASISNSFTVTPAAAYQLAFVQQPGNVVAGVANSPAITVDILDQFGNVVTTDTSTVTLTVASGPGSATGALTAAAVNGISSFGNARFNTSGGYTLTASDNNLTQVVSSSFAVVPASASKLVFSQQPSNVTAGAVDAPSIVVDVEDQFGNVVTTDSSTVTIAVASGPGAANGTLAVAALNGIVTFSNVKANVTGTYTLTASSGGLSSATSSAFAVVPASASQLVYVVQPSNTTAGITNRPSIIVAVEDPFGNVVTTDNSILTLAVASGPGIASGNLTATASNGIAVFDNVNVAKAGTYTLNVNDGSLPSATSTSFAVTAAAATQLVYVQQPSDAIAGIADSPSITVDVEDPFGNIVSTDSSTVTLTVASGAADAIGTQTAVASAGVAAFSNLILTTAGTYSLTASDASLTTTTSGTFNVIPATPSKVVFAQQPSGVVAGIAVAPAITVDVEDQFGNIVSSDGSDATLTISSGPGVATGILTAAASSGVSTFSTVGFDVAGAYTLTVSDGALSSATSNSFTVVPAEASRLVYAQQPSDAVAGVAVAPSIVIDVEDQFGNIVTADSSTVTLTVASGPATIGGTMTVSAANGIATFVNMELDTAGTYALAADDGLLAPAISRSFTVTAAGASQLAFAQEPSDATAGAADSPSIVVNVEDQFGNIVATDNSTVTLAFATHPSGATGTLTAAAISGVATFENVIFDTAGLYTLASADRALTPATSDVFTITSAAASTLTFVQQPGDAIAGAAIAPSIVVDIEDQYGNVVTNDESSVSISVASGPGSAIGTLSITAINGVAAFNDVQLDTVGAYALTVIDGPLAPATSNSFTVVSATASQLVFVNQPGDTEAGMVEGGPITVNLEDQFGNIVTTDGSNVTINVDSGPGGAGGTLTAAAAGGIATFGNVYLDLAGTYTLTTSDSSLAPATSNSFFVSPTNAAKVAYIQQPGDITAGIIESAAIIVDVEDQYGNVVATDGSAVTLAVQTGPGMASEILTVAAVNGVATFSDVEFFETGSYALIATDFGLTSATSIGFAVSAAAATQLVFSQQPSDVVTGVADSPAIIVAVEDHFGNLVSTDASAVTLTVASGPGSTGGLVFVDAVSGVATFGDVVFDAAGSYTLTATDSSLSPATSGVFTVSPSVAAMLVFVQQPSDVAAGADINPSIVVEVEDQFGNIITTDASTISLAVESGPGSAGGIGDSVALNGVATFDDVTLYSAGGYTLGATDGSLTSATSTLFTVNPAAAAQLVYSQQPSNVTAGLPVSPAIVVDVEDEYGNIVNENDSGVTLYVASGPGIPAGTMTGLAVNGVATFDDVTFDTAGNYSLIATDGGLATATCGNFMVTTAVASRLVYVQGPSDALAGAIESPAIVIDVEDQYGNIVATDNSTASLAVVGGPDSAIAGGTVSASAVNGVITFSNVQFSTAGNYTLAANDASLTPAISPQFTIGPDSTSISLSLSDGSSAYGQIVGFTATLKNSLMGGAIPSGAVTFMDGSVVLGTAPVDRSGVAMFTTSTAVVGTHPIRAMYSGDVDFMSSSSLPSTLVISQDSTATSLAASSNPAPFSRSLTFTATVQSNLPGSGIPTGLVLFEDGSAVLGTGMLDSSGIASFTIASLLVGDHLISAVYAGDTNDVGSASSAIHLPVNQTPTMLIVVMQPSAGIAGQTLSAVQISIQDAFGNAVTGDTSTVTVAGDFAIGGTTTVTAVDGVATFSNLSIDVAGIHILYFADGLLGTAADISFNIVPAAPAGLVIINQPSSKSFQGANIGLVNVEVVDAYGNIVTTDSSTVTLSGGPGLLGTTSVAAQGGVASFPGLAFAGIGTYSLIATDSGLSSVTTDPITVTPTYTGIAGARIAPISIDANALFPQIDGGLQSVGIVIQSQSNNSWKPIAETIRLKHGKAMISSLKLLRAGNYTLTISDRHGHASTEQITVVAGIPSKLMFTNQPTRLDGTEVITVAAVDRYGNLCSLDDSTRVTLNLDPKVHLGPHPVLTGPITATVVDGIARFTDISVNYQIKGKDRLIATAAGLVSVISQVFQNPGVMNSQRPAK